MKKFTILVIFSHLLLAFMALGLTLASCEDPSNGRGDKEGETTFTVRFDRNGGRGTVPGPITAAAGSSITLPDGDGLSKSGYVFGGWNTEADGEGTYYDEGESFTPTGNVTLYAQWDEVVTYTVSFDSNGGSSVAAQTVNEGDTVTRPANPTKSGYTFVSWCRNAALTGGYNFFTPVTEDITLYARWVAVSAGSFIVAFDSNGGSYVATQTVNSGDTATRPADPTQSNYTFDNWYCDSDMITVYNFSTPVTDNITLYAKWIPVVTVVTYTVTFNSNGATGGTAPIAQTVNAGSSITLPGGSGLSKTGSAFGGWNTRADGAGTNHAADSSYMVQNNITLYALWIIVPADSFTVTFDSNGGSSVDMGIVQSGGTATRPADPARSGYTFDNWYSNAGLTTVYNFSTPVTENIILYARWNPITYTVTFNINGGSGTVPPVQTANAGSNITLAIGSGLIKSGFNFGGWNTNAAGTGTNYPAGSSYPVTGDITLYAQWDTAAATTYTVSFDTNGGSGTAPSAQTANAGSSITLPNGSGLTRIGFAFTGWNTNASGTGTNYSAGAAYTPGADTTLYAEWEDSTTTYTVSFDSNGGNGTPPGHQIVTFGSSITLPNGNALSRTYYTFGGWNTKADGTGTTYNAGASYIVIGNATLYAKWDGITYTVTFSVNGGSGAVPPMPAQAGSSITLPGGSSLSRTNYTFGGWNTNASGTGTNYDAGDSYTVTGTITLYAQWEGTVTFNLNGGTGTTPSAQTAAAGSIITLPSGSGLTRTVYTFGGWNTNESGTGTNYNGGSAYTVTGSITLYAQYIPVEMVHVPGGSFEMGENLGTGGGRDVTPVHTVTVTGFYMGKYEVTQEQYRMVMGSNPGSGYGVGDKYPVYDVSWYDALVFCNKLSIAEGLTPAYRISNSTDPSEWGTVPTYSNSTAWDSAEIVSGSTGYRLPTEAQWEYAAKGGNPAAGGWVGYTYAGSDNPDEVAWYWDNSGSKTHEVGKKLPNGLGIYDMSGNVWEWCWDWYGSYTSTAQTDPSGASSGSYRVLRGGSWDDSAEGVFRFIYYPYSGRDKVGFRLARP